MASALLVAYMLLGSFGDTVVQATHPFIVVEDEQVVGSFSTLELAEDFIGQEGGAACVLRHSGQKWVMAKARQVNSFLSHANFALKRKKA